MTTMQQQTLTVQAAQKLLKNYDCMSSKTVDSEAEKALLRQALLLLTEHSDYQILGICADTAYQGIATLKSYLEAFGYEENLNLPLLEGTVYIKFNLKNGSSYINSYEGSHRGVLVSCQSLYEGGINEMYGHLPLDLFMDVS
ncbi:DUF1824 family protein [Crinalium epipsammum]|uniref:DUF1824 family protein n=1 Tax=Crinalium epipsammum TaxID=241425 RepID=UPI0036F1F5CD